ncbi:hypothetical protein Tcan_16250 [Toxocara canis]|uniref:Sushi domain-containing protein n=1 Tax=Toxocara canis TaxID=6265 RepID=A0A0B2V000_TOXCA|nr:hypothetical protein Tcan_16250 [Toxocara canis]
MQLRCALFAFLTWIPTFYGVFASLFCPFTTIPKEISLKAAHVYLKEDGIKSIYRISTKHIDGFVIQPSEILVSENQTVRGCPEQCMMELTANQATAEHGSVLHQALILERMAPQGYKLLATVQRIYCVTVNGDCGANVPIYRYYRLTQFGIHHAYSFSKDTNINGYTIEGSPICFGWSSLQTATASNSDIEMPSEVETNLLITNFTCEQNAISDDVLVTLNVFENKRPAPFHDHYYTTKRSVAIDPESGSYDLFGYVLKDQLGRVAKSKGSCDCLIEMRQMIDTQDGIFARIDHKFVESGTEKDRPNEHYFELEEHFFCASQQNACGATLPLRKFFHLTNIDSLYTVNDTTPPVGSAPYPSGVLCYIWDKGKGEKQEKNEVTELIDNTIEEDQITNMTTTEDASALSFDPSTTVLKGANARIDHKFVESGTEKDRPNEHYFELEEHFFCASQQNACGATLPLRKFFHLTNIDSLYTVNDTTPPVGSAPYPSGVLCYIWDKGKGEKQEKNEVTELIDNTIEEDQITNMTTTEDASALSFDPSTTVLKGANESFCEVLAGVENGWIIYNSTAGAQFVQVAELKCKQGFRVIGPTRLICLDNSEWFPEAAFRGCKPVQQECTALPSASNGTIIYSEKMIESNGSRSYAPMTVASLDCAPGSTAVSVTKLICLESGEWFPSSAFKGCRQAFIDKHMTEGTGVQMKTSCVTLIGVDEMMRKRTQSEAIPPKKYVAQSKETNRMSASCGEQTNMTHDGDISKQYLAEMVNVITANHSVAKIAEILSDLSEEKRNLVFQTVRISSSKSENLNNSAADSEKVFNVSITRINDQISVIVVVALEATLNSSDGSLHNKNKEKLDTDLSTNAPSTSATTAVSLEEKQTSKIDKFARVFPSMANMFTGGHKRKADARLAQRGPLEEMTDIATDVKWILSKGASAATTQTGKQHRTVEQSKSNKTIQSPEPTAKSVIISVSTPLQSKTIIQRPSTTELTPSGEIRVEMIDTTTLRNPIYETFAETFPHNSSLQNNSISSDLDNLEVNIIDK